MTQSFEPRARRTPLTHEGLRGPEIMDARLGMATTDGREPQTIQPEGDGIPDISGLNMKQLQPPTDPKARRKWKFRSKNTNHRVQLITTLDVITAGGRVQKGKTIAAQFRMGYFETENPEYAAILFDNKNCGLGMDYWDAELEDHEAAKAQYQAFKDAVKKNPSAFVQLFKDIQAGDFDDVMKSDLEQQAQAEVEAEMSQQMDPDGDGLAGQIDVTQGGQTQVPLTSPAPLTPPAPLSPSPLPLGFGQ